MDLVAQSQLHVTSSFAPRQYRVMNSLILDDFIVILGNFLRQLMMPFFLEEHCDYTENRDSALRRLFKLVPVVAMT